MFAKFSIFCTFNTSVEGVSWIFVTVVRLKNQNDTPTRQFKERRDMTQY